MTRYFAIKARECPYVTASFAAIGEAITVVLACED